MSEIDIDKLAKRGDITSDNHRKAISCDDCRTTWYGRTDPFNKTGATVATEFCPYCGGDSVEVNEELPGAILLNPGVDWPEDDPFIGDGASD
jgi:Zn finger protein HypA/HybF involved in hydrogenase expression